MTLTQPRTLKNFRLKSKLGSLHDVRVDFLANDPFHAISEVA